MRSYPHQIMSKTPPESSVKQQIPGACCFYRTQDYYSRIPISGIVMSLRAVHHHTHPYTLTLLLSGLVKGDKIHQPCFVFRKRMQKEQDMNCICKLHRIPIHISKSMNIAYCPSVLLPDSHVQCSSNLCPTVMLRLLVQHFSVSLFERQSVSCVS